MSRQMKLRLFFLAVVAVLIVTGGGYWYLRVYTKTPEYAMQQIEQSVEQHDKAKFQRYVDVERLLDRSYDGFVEGLLTTDTMMTPEAKSAISSFTHMMKAPLLTSFRTAIEQYVESGTWEAAESQEAGNEALDASDVLKRSGLQQAVFRSVDGISQDKDGDRAIASVRVYQEEAQREFVLEVVLEKAENGDWRITEIQNFDAFIQMVSQARHEELKKYMRETASIMDKHDRTIHDAELTYRSILASGSLGSQATRDEIQALMRDVVQKDWETRKEALSELVVPAAAQTLHHLRLKICDLHIEYAQSYAQWMSDKKAATIREADAKLKQAKTLEKEASILVTRMTLATTDS